MDYVYEAGDGPGYVNKSCHFTPATGSDGVKYVILATRTLGPYTDDTTQGQSPTKADVQAFVEKALAYVEAHGKEAALAAFTQEGGEFHQGERYIYAYDFSGSVLAHGGNPLQVGQNLIDQIDANGDEVSQKAVSSAAGEQAGETYYCDCAHATVERTGLALIRPAGPGAVGDPRYR